ncbi:MAG TPA: hypothetical protein VF789_22855 [Thermoanaerobaculia bacterium]
MKKLSVRLSLLCMLAVLLIPFAGCKKDETEVEETPAMSSDTMATSEPMMTSEPMTSGTSDMGTDMTTSEPVTTDTPPAGQ